MANPEVRSEIWHENSAPTYLLAGCEQQIQRKMKRSEQESHQKELTPRNSPKPNTQTGR